MDHPDAERWIIRPPDNLEGLGSELLKSYVEGEVSFEMTFIPFNPDVEIVMATPLHVEGGI